MLYFLGRVDGLGTVELFAVGVQVPDSVRAVVMLLESVCAPVKLAAGGVLLVLEVELKVEADLYFRLGGHQDGLEALFGPGYGNAQSFAVWPKREEMGSDKGVQVEQRVQCAAHEGRQGVLADIRLPDLPFKPGHINCRPSY